jgi:hypothetical protein
MAISCIRLACEVPEKPVDKQAKKIKPKGGEMEWEER